MGSRNDPRPPSLFKMACIYGFRMEDGIPRRLCVVILQFLTDTYPYPPNPDYPTPWDNEDIEECIRNCREGEAFNSLQLLEVIKPLAEGINAGSDIDFVNKEHLDAYFKALKKFLNSDGP